MEAIEKAAPAEFGAASTPVRPARPKRAVTSVVERECGQIGKYRVRVVRTSEKPDAPRLLDVREWVKGTNYEGFTRKGVRLGATEARGLKSILEEVTGLLL